MKPIIHNTSDVEKKFAVLKSSLASLAEQIDELAKRLDLFMLAVSQSSPKCQLPVTLPSQDQMGNVVIGESLGEATSGETVTTLNSSASIEVKRLESMLEELSASVLSLTCISQIFFSITSLVWKIAMCKVKGINNPTKQDNIIHWHKEMNNLISVVIETKLRGKIHLWIMNKFDGVRVFTSGLDSGYLGSGVVIIMNISLAKHVCKVFEVPGCLLSFKLLFKNNLSVLILGLYTGTSLVVWFSQAGEINFLIAKAVNKFSFVVLGGDFNKDGSRKCASFKKCFDLGLVNSLGESLFVKTPTWTNSCGVTKALDYVLISLSLVNAVTDGNVANVEEYFDTDHKAVSASMGLGGLLDVCLSSIRKQANKDCWKFDVKSIDIAKWGEFKDATAANTVMFLDKFEVAKKFSDLNAMWNTVRKVMVFLANGAFKKKWFKGYDGVFTKESSKLHNLEVLVSKIVKASCKADTSRFEFLWIVTKLLWFVIL
ncbi:hypothetical protein G9A89_019428 [Geosiphon pyriformis]|nr:hypothetical protein G9A89_019428 [Geosiphon pyriformis]